MIELEEKMSPVSYQREIEFTKENGRLGWLGCLWRD